MINYVKVIKSFIKVSLLKVLYIYIFIYICIYTNIFIYICIYTCLYIYIHGTKNPEMHSGKRVRVAHIFNHECLIHLPCTFYAGKSVPAS